MGNGPLLKELGIEGGADTCINFFNHPNDGHLILLYAAFPFKEPSIIHVDNLRGGGSDQSPRLSMVGEEGE